MHRQIAEVRYQEVARLVVRVHPAPTAAVALRHASVQLSVSEEMLVLIRRAQDDSGEGYCVSKEGETGTTGTTGAYIVTGVHGMGRAAPASPGWWLIY
eukprot:COSAG02_NODE_10139_length_2013_cov_1.164054_2_plen_98_part_00